MEEAYGGGGRPAWAPRSWGPPGRSPKDGGPEGAGGPEELDVDPRELARRIRAHRARGGRGLIDLDAPWEPGEDQE